jgi:pimeloyl-ACP methyl ester carboxylesterase
VLVTPFDSLVAVAARHYWFLPVRLLLRHRFPSTQWAAQTQAPALVLAAERDFVVPPAHARALHEAWHGPKQFHLLADVGHNNIELNPSYYELINQFLGSVRPNATQ